MSLFEYDRAIIAENGGAAICGMDEVGRGPLAGPVSAAAVILKPDCYIEGLNDSKKLTAKKREQLYDEIIKNEIGHCIINVTADIIDEMNILQATLFAMRSAMNNMDNFKGIVLVDGNADPKFEQDVETRLVVGGDAKSACIAAASILAKVFRDEYMLKIHEQYPQYGFDKHKGYGTKAHYAALDKYGPCKYHRESFLKKWRAGKQ